MRDKAAPISRSIRPFCAVEVLLVLDVLADQHLVAFFDAERIWTYSSLEAPMVTLEVWPLPAWT
jgi:hypothetical protein